MRMGFIRKDEESGMRQVKLTELLDEGTLKKLDPIMARIKAKKLDVSKGKEEILKILEPIRKELEAKGVLADYLAWYLTWVATQI